ncbi:MAG: biopolymer transporter ExbD [Kiritimatiellae bacterium]|nr:biopolymer transporter ExbD [Kiritimatiellia bacterium]
MNFRKKHRMLLPDFQITPMIDCVFLLLCFFVTTQVFSQWETEIDIKLPTAEKGVLPERLPGEIIINVRKDGTMVVNQQVLDRLALRNMLARIVAMYPGQPVLIRADKQTPYEYIITVLDLCRQVDIWNISFATAFPEKTER